METPEITIFSVATEKKARVTNIFGKVTDLHAWERADWWASALLLGELLFTGSNQHWMSAIYQKKKKKKKKSSEALRSAASHCSGERREVTNGMLWSSIGLGPSRRFPFDKSAFGTWAAGTQEPHCILCWKANMKLVAGSNHRGFSIDHRNRT